VAETKGRKTNILTKQILKPSVAIVVETHSELDIVAIEVNNQMVVIQVQMGKNIVEDVLIDGRANVNIIIENL
jgi:Fe-S cluster assembly ATPase SufC